MNLKIGICDDSSADSSKLFALINDFALRKNLFLNVYRYSSGRELLTAYRNKRFDIIFLDIEMPGQSGMSAARQIREEGGDDALIIFVTSYPEYMRDSFDVQPFQFLTKPVDSAIIDHVMLKILDKYRHSHTIRFITDIDEVTHQVRLKDIIYMRVMKGEKNQLTYIIAGQDSFSSKGTIQEAENELGRNGFISPYRSFLVNIRHIKTFDHNSIRMDNGDVIPVSRRKYAQIQQQYAHRLIRLLN